MVRIGSAVRTRCAAFLFAVVGFLVSAAVSQTRAELLVVATTPDLKSIVDAVSGGIVHTESLVPPGADPEAFEPRPSHLALLRDAALIIRVGLGYDEWLDRLLQQTQNPRLRQGGVGYLDLSKDIALLEVQGRSVEARSGHAHGSANPHYWLDPANVEIMSASIAEALTQIVPGEHETIVAAQARFAADLRDRLQRWTAILEPYRGTAIVTYHNSWPYFARRFRLNIIDVIEPKEGVQPSAARLAALAGRMRDANVRAILHEPFEPPDTSRLLAQRTGARVVVLAPSVGASAEANDILALFDKATEVLAAALKEGD